MNSQIQAFKENVQKQQAMENVRHLVQKVNDHCFARCIPKPESTFSPGESTCYSACMEKYMASWDIVAKQYVSNLSRMGGIQ